MNKAVQLKKMRLSKDLANIMEAHHGLSALIVQGAEFKGICGERAQLAND